MTENIIVWGIVGILVAKSYKVFVGLARKEGVSILFREPFYVLMTMLWTCPINVVAPLEWYSLIASVIGFITQDILEKTFNKG